MVADAIKCIVIMNKAESNPKKYCKACTTFILLLKMKSYENQSKVVFLFSMDLGGACCGFRPAKRPVEDPARWKH
jgi:hypothetical protein